jgi:hypothetical protein
MKSWPKPKIIHKRFIQNNNGHDKKINPKRSSLHGNVHYDNKSSAIIKAKEYVKLQRLI